MAAYKDVQVAISNACKYVYNNGLVTNVLTQLFSNTDASGSIVFTMPGTTGIVQTINHFTCNMTRYVDGKKTYYGMKKDINGNMINLNEQLIPELLAGNLADDNVRSIVAYMAIRTALVRMPDSRAFAMSSYVLHETMQATGLIVGEVKPDGLKVPVSLSSDNFTSLCAIGHDMYSQFPIIKTGSKKTTDSNPFTTIL